MNDVSRELGAALGIAITGSIVSGLYRSNIDESLTRVVPDEFVETASEGSGVAAIAAQSLPADVASVVVEAASTAFVDAFATGLLVSAGIMAVATVAAVLLLPSRMLTDQVDDRLRDARVEFDRPAGDARVEPAFASMNDSF